MAKIIKKAQNGKVIDKTSVSRPKRKPDTVATKPNYTYLKSSKKDQSPTSQDSINYKRGFNKGKKDKQSLFMSSDMNSYMGSVEGSRNTEKSKKLKSGGAVKKLQNGGGTTKTKDSTDYFKNRASEAVFERGRTRDKNIINKSSISKKTQDDKSAVDKISNLNESVARQSKKGKLGYDANGKKKMKAGGMIKRADGSMSKRGLWDNIRANKGSGKKPTASMLKQEKKIKSKAKK